MTTQLNAGDTLKLPNGDATIEDAEGRMVTLDDGREYPYDKVEQGIHYGQIDHVPAGTGDRDVYVRFGDIPEDEQSYDNRNGRKESGVSVYACEEEDGVYYLKGNMLQTVFAMLNRTMYLVSGERVGTGADGEPVIRNVEIETELRTPKGCGGFIPRDEA